MDGTVKVLSIFILRDCADLAEKEETMKKECPSCAMEIDNRSRVCPICGYEFPGYSGIVKWVAFLLALLFLLSYFLI